MNYYLSVSPRAKVDVEENFAFIAKENVDAALRFYDAAFASFDQLADTPFIGTVKHFANSVLSLRRWFVQGFNHYLIFYRVSTSTVEIVRVLHSSRDIEKALVGDDEEIE